MQAGTTIAVIIAYIGALIAPLFCPRSWFSHQLDGHAGKSHDNDAVFSEDENFCGG